ncbi:MAG: HAD family hydrolase [Candidatus Omnitrophica bacterium]|nr:HAD family hydrolase [Candidatus Omnitrophota bacterium]
MKVIFLDRDGVINKYPGDTKYVTSLKGFRFLPNTKKAISLLTKNKFKIFVASNQAGVGKGVYTQEVLNAITAYMLKEVKKQDGLIEKVYYCTHRPQDNCSCRKPKPGLIRAAKKEYALNLKDSFFIGDTIRDINTARAAGCKSILVLSGKEKLSNKENWEAKPDFVFKDLFEAAKFLVKQS